MGKDWSTCTNLSSVQHNNALTNKTEHVDSRFDVFQQEKTRKRPGLDLCVEDYNKLERGEVIDQTTLLYYSLTDNLVLQ